MKRTKEFTPKKPRPKMWSETLSPKRKSLKNEKRLSKEVGFRLTPGSGNLDWAGCKGDGSHPDFIFELKETEKASIRISESVVAKLYREAAAIGKDPVFILSAYGLSEPLPKDWVVIPVDVFKKLVESTEVQDG